MNRCERLQSYYGTINVVQVAEWFLIHDKKLFNKNIRNYRESSDVNEGIRKVLKENPRDFVYFNNGLKALCNKITRKTAKRAHPVSSGMCSPGSRSHDKVFFWFELSEGWPL